MACPQVTTSRGFLVETLAHLDCQAQSIGSFGFESLAGPGSAVGAVLTAFLTLFVAILGIRLLLGARLGASDAVGAVLKVGIVLTLATSWPAYRIIAYDTVLRGPAEIAVAIGSSTLPDLRGGLAGRLQGIDDGIMALTAAGLGRQVGALQRPGEAPDRFADVALEDEAALGWGRAIFLAATIGTVAVLRLAGGLLLALAPLFAGLLLLDVSRGLFAGWLRGLVLVALGSLGLTLLLAVEVALMEPWIRDVLSRRSLGYATPQAATEWLALSLGFALAGFGLIALLAKVAFQNGWSVNRTWRSEARTTESGSSYAQGSTDAGPLAQSRALAVNEAMLLTMRREGVHSESLDRRMVTGGSERDEKSAEGSHSRESLGTSYRRTLRRGSSAKRRRDERP